MPCYTPLKAYRAPGGGVAFSSKEGYSDRPLELPCGQCRGCRLERSRQWALRIMHETQTHQCVSCKDRAKSCDHHSFLTLTYDKEHLPENGSLKIEDWQRFAKRLRKAIGPFRFYHCGEYGERNGRPHYHACVFGIDFSQDRMLLQQTRGTNLYASPMLEQTWGKGQARIGHLTWQSAAYVARYCMGKITGTLARKVHYGDRLPEYATMSRRPGIGSAWFAKFHSEVYPADEVVHNGRKFKPPRYYDEKLDPDQLMRVKDQRADKAAKFSQDKTPERLRVREEVAKARTKQLTRQL